MDGGKSVSAVQRRVIETCRHFRLRLADDGFATPPCTTKYYVETGPVVRGDDEVLGCIAWLFCAPGCADREAEDILVAAPRGRC